MHNHAKSSTAHTLTHRIRRCLCHSAFYLLLLRAAAFAHAHDPPTRLSFHDADIPSMLRTDFYGAYLGSQRAGWARMSTSRTSDPQKAGFVRQFELHTGVKAGGIVQRLDQLELCEFDANPPYTLRYGEYRAANGRTALKTTLTRRSNDGFDVMTANSGQITNKSIGPIDFNFADVIASKLWVRSNPKPGSILVSRALDFEGIGIGAETRKILQTKTTVMQKGKADVMEVGFGNLDDRQTNLERYDRADGKLLSVQIGGLLELRLEPEKVAKDTAISLDLLELAKVKVDRALGKPERVRGLVLETAGNADFLLRSGPRQTVTCNPNGTYTIKLGTASGSASVKATPQEIKDALAETMSLPVNHPKVRELAKKAVGATKDPHLKVKRLAKFVSEYVTASLTADPLTLLDLIDEKAGCCRHRAALLTALARAEQIPAREVGGLLYAGDAEKAFGFHAWTEVCLDGDWVPVDPMSEETEIDATHIRLGEPAQEISMEAAIFGKLQLKVIEVMR
jgi:hypothetical protein